MSEEDDSFLIELEVKRHKETMAVLGAIKDLLSRKDSNEIVAGLRQVADKIEKLPTPQVNVDNDNSDVVKSVKELGLILTTKLDTLKPPQKETKEFIINRDFNGYIKSVTVK